MELTSKILDRRRNFIKENVGKTFEIIREALTDEDCTHLVAKGDRVITITGYNEEVLKKYLEETSVFLADLDKVRRDIEGSNIIAYYVFNNEEEYIKIDII